MSMRKDINLTVCLQFRNEYERNLVRETDRQRRIDGKKPIAETLLGGLLQANRLGIDAEGEIEFGGKKYIIVISQTP